MIQSLQELKYLFFFHLLFPKRSDKLQDSSLTFYFSLDFRTLMPSTNLSDLYLKFVCEDGASMFDFCLVKVVLNRSIRSTCEIGTLQV